MNRMITVEEFEQECKKSWLRTLADPNIFDMGDAFQDAIHFGTGIMKTTVFPDGEILMYPITRRMELFFETEYDHGNGD